MSDHDGQNIEVSVLAGREQRERAERERAERDKRDET